MVGGVYTKKCGEIHYLIKDYKTWSTVNDTSQCPWMKKTCNFPIFDTIRRYVWKAIAPEASNPGTPKLELEVRMVIRTAQARPIIPVVQIYITYSTLDLLCIISFGMQSP